MRTIVTSPHAIAQRLRPLPLFSGTDEEALGTVARAARLLQLDPSEVLAQQATVLPGFFLVLDGALEWTDSSERIPWVHPGHVAAAATLPHSLRAGPDGATCFYVPLSAFLDLLDSEPAWAVAMTVAMEVAGTWR